MQYLNILALTVSASATPGVLNGLSNLFGSSSTVGTVATTTSTVVASASPTIVGPIENVTLPTLWDNICDAQIAVCDLSCNQTLPFRNLCDAKSQTWSCVCPGTQKPTIPEWSMPAGYQGCSEGRTKCEENCGIGSGGDDNQWYTCVNQCNDKWTCGTQAQPVSEERNDGETEEEFNELKKSLTRKVQIARQPAALDTQSASSAFQVASAFSALFAGIAMI